jgi:catechol 2,3-dioxygenase-like lactoylglutathione lyase family enzyme
MMRGLANVSLFAEDLDTARAWYTEVLGAEPYFVVPGGYLEWRVGDDGDELGIVQAGWAPHPVGVSGGSGAIVYWHVDDVRSAHERLLALGATPHDAPRERGEGFVTSSVLDPFGNVLGVMENPHWVEMVRPPR